MAALRTGCKHSVGGGGVVEEEPLEITLMKCKLLRPLNVNYEDGLSHQQDSQNKVETECFKMLI